MVSIIPEQTALIVVDMQKGACHPDGTLGRSGVDLQPARETIPRVRELVEFCRGYGIPDIWTVQHHYAVDRGREAHRIPHHTTKRATIAFQKGSFDAEIVDELKGLIGPTTEVIEKHKWSGFYCTRLLPLLRILGSRLVIVVGLTTNLCVETTARDAAMHDFDVVLVGDCIAGVNPDWDAFSKQVWQFYIGEVVQLHEVREMIRAGAGELVTADA